MTTRHFPDWLDAFVDYASYGEAPRRMYFWAGVSAVAGALQRKVWIDQTYFKWYPNFYICLVAPPGIVSKSTTAGIAMNLLRQVPGVRFGPDVVTWPALVSAFAAATEAFEYKGEWLPQSAMTLESSEFGNLLDPRDKDMVDLLVSLWDGKPGAFKKETKHSGNDSVENPWINLIACTTPSWIAGNFPEYMIGGGFTSRTVFVYADKKDKYIPYLDAVVPAGHRKREEALIADLTEISKLVGEFKLSPEAKAWGTQWYKEHYARPSSLDPEIFGGYVARKQTHIHKLAMVLSASRGDSLVIEEIDLKIAEYMVTDLEADMAQVFSRVGQSESAAYATRIVSFVTYHKKAPYSSVYQYIYNHFPGMRDFDDIMAGLVRAGFVKLVNEGGEVFVIPGISMIPQQEKKPRAAKPSAAATSPASSGTKS